MDKLWEHSLLWLCEIFLPPRSATSVMLLAIGVEIRTARTCRSKNTNNAISSSFGD